MKRLLFLCGLAAVIAHSQPKAQPNRAAAQQYFTDTVLIDQNGAPHRLYSDLMKDKVVVINVMFTDCQDSCPMLTANQAKVQEWLGDRLGKDVLILSITVDPDHDTPPKLKAFAEKFHAKPGWYFLTGEKQKVFAILTRLGMSVSQKEDHSNIFLIGNDRTSLWKKVFGMAPASQLISILDGVISDRV
jgi:protein SCO1/2